MLERGYRKAAQMIVRHFYGRPGFGYRGPGVIRLLILAVLVALLIVAVVRLLYMRRAFAARSQGWRQRQWGAGPGGPGLRRGADPAIHELRLRYARGELSREEFLERSHDLGAPGGGEPPPAG
jgi:uncharacterized membrane protein